MTEDLDKELTLDDLRFNPPEFPKDQLADFVQKAYGLSGPLKYLKGERDQNHKLTTSDGQEFVVKVSASNEDTQLVDLQVQSLLHVEKVAPDLNVPRIIPTLDGRSTTQIFDVDGQPHEARLLSFIPGVAFGDGAAPSLKVLKEVGSFQGKLCKAFTSFHHPASKMFMPWDISNGLALNPSLAKGKFGDVEELVVPLLDHFRDVVFPALKPLRQQVIHNDGHQGNLLRSKQDADDFVGVIDFGDLVEAPLIDDLAVSMADLMPASENPIEASAAIVEGFNEHFPLLKEEIEILFDLCLVRAALVIQLFDFRIRNSEVPTALDLKEYPIIVSDFKSLLSINKQEATQRWLQVCNKT